VEYQIAQNIHRFVEDYCSDRPEAYSSSQEWADALHVQYGSTIRGLVQWHREKNTSSSIKRLQELFYGRVYRDLDYSSLLDSWNADTGVCTGYGTLSTATTKNGRDVSMPAGPTLALRKLLNSIAVFSVTSPLVQLQLASNSPRHHVETVLQALGMCRVPFSELYTPDYRGSRDDIDQPLEEGEEVSYPTKYDPRSFFRSAAFVTPNENSSTAVYLIDDSGNVVQAVQRELSSECIQALHLTHHQLPIPSLLQAVAMAMEWVPLNFTLDEARYLQAKNQVDAASIHTETFQRMLRELHHSVQQQSCTNDFTIVDVGAGVLFMLRFLLQTSNDGPLSLMSIAARRHLHYFAYEPNRALLPSCIEQLEELGFMADPLNPVTSATDRPLVFHRPATEDHRMTISVHLCLCDFRAIPSSSGDATPWKPCAPPHLIVGCCFADLMAPTELIPALMRTFLLSPPSNSTTLDATNEKHPDRRDIWSQVLMYFPITFTGVTSTDPPQPFDTTSWQRPQPRSIPSDTTAFHYYSQALQEGPHPHHLQVDALIATVQDYGGTLLQQSSSDWIIAPEPHGYLWNCLLYFFGITAAPALQADGWDARGWLHRLRQTAPVLRASNVDLLFRLPPLGQWHWTAPASTSHEKISGLETPRTYQEILFTGPRQVTCVDKQASEQLPPHQVRIQTEYSLISSGTELKIFRGQFDDDNDEPLDTTIAGFSESRLAYPLAYGYSLVGRIVECGASVDAEEWRIGQRVFTFAAHASQVMADASQILRVPDDVEAADAIFLPALETAVSLIQDAAPVLGENIAVFGQGLIGLLVTALLSPTSDAMTRASFGQFGTLTTFDVNPVRRALSAALGASQTLDPGTSRSQSGPFDVIIEVSGNARALQMAIDATRRGGRVIIGSWYGGGRHHVVPLQLGLAFHRSHITLRTSQVSDVPAELSMRWSKARRFALTWALVRQVRPSRLISRRTTLRESASAYRALEEGTEVAVAFQYDDAATATSGTK
jgi:threonine dehydrogenase-like Zn-dependent dehydrogenase